VLDHGAMVGLTVRPASRDDWAIVKEARLRALSDSPAAFGSTLARELEFDDAEWQRRVEPGNWYVASFEGRTVGLVATIGVDGSPHERHLVAMWVEPEMRGTPAATELVEAVCTKARSDGTTEITLWVVEENQRAKRFYERLGFLPTGEQQPLPSDPALAEHKMRLQLAANSGM
jgi:ribosomal protein S18 acetylase RimI-like enzyme